MRPGREVDDGISDDSGNPYSGRKLLAKKASLAKVPNIPVSPYGRIPQLIESSSVQKLDDFAQDKNKSRL